MTARIPDTLDPATLRWLADREQAREEEMREIRNVASLAIFRGERLRDVVVEERMDAAIVAARSRSIWLRAAATRIENRRGRR